MLCHAGCPLWLPIIILQQSPSFISTEDYEQNTKKSGLMDSRWLQNIAITGLTPINLYLQKIRGRSQLKMHSLLFNHILCFLMSLCNEFLLCQHPLSLNSLTRRQHGLIKGHLVDMDNYFNEVFPSFDPINTELFPSHRIIDIHANRFSFHPFSKQASHSINSWV